MVSFRQASVHGMVLYCNVCVLGWKRSSGNRAVSMKPLSLESTGYFWSSIKISWLILMAFLCVIYTDFSLLAS